MNDLTKSVSEIVAAFISHNHLPPGDLNELIVRVHGALQQVTSGETAEIPAVELVPAVPIKKSVRPDSITCLICGRSFKSLRRHLNADHQLMPDAYRAKWGLDEKYPMVAPEYAKIRSQLAKTSGLGSKLRSSPRVAPPTAETETNAPKPRGRPRKVTPEATESPAKPVRAPEPALP